MSIDFETASSEALTMPAGTALAQNRGTLTLACWAIPESIVNANLLGVSTNNAGVPTSNTRAAMKVEAAGELQGQLRAPDSGARVDGSSAAGTVTTGGLPQHLVAAWDVAGDDLKLYRNGVEVADPAVAFTNAATDNTSSASGAFAAEEDAAAPFYDGELADALAYSKKLSADLIATMYATRGAVIPYDSLLSRWQMKELGSGTQVAAGASVKDGGISRAHLTRVGLPVYSAIRLRFRRQIG